MPKPSGNNVKHKIKKIKIKKRENIAKTQAVKLQNTQTWKSLAVKTVKIAKNQKCQNLAAKTFKISNQKCQNLASRIAK